jgi:predicted chitinase
MRDAGITTWRRVVMLAAQLGHESRGLQDLRERGGSNYCRRCVRAIDLDI